MSTPSGPSAAGRRVPTAPGATSADAASRERALRAERQRTEEQLAAQRAGGLTAASGANASQRVDRETAAAYELDDAEPRQVKLTLNRINTFSALKISFLISVGLGIAGVILTFVLWSILNNMGVFSQINDAVSEIPAGAGNTKLSVADYLTLSKVLSYSVIVGFVDVFLLTAIGTLLAIMYNLCAALVGGLRVTLSDE